MVVDQSDPFQYKLFSSLQDTYVSGYSNQNKEVNVGYKSGLEFGKEESKIVQKAT